MLTGYRWEYILHGRGVVVLTFMGVGQVLFLCTKLVGKGRVVWNVSNYP